MTYNTSRMCAGICNIFATLDPLRGEIWRKTAAGDRESSSRGDDTVRWRDIVWTCILSANLLGVAMPVALTGQSELDY
jgi:hypothetical protein